MGESPSSHVGVQGTEVNQLRTQFSKTPRAGEGGEAELWFRISYRSQSENSSQGFHALTLSLNGKPMAYGIHSEALFLFF